MMLRITVRDSNQVRTIRLEGRLGPPALQELERCWSDAQASRKRILQVDLTGVTSVEPEGKAALKSMHERGAEFIAEDCLMIDMVEEFAQAANSKPTSKRTRHLSPAHEEGETR